MKTISITTSLVFSALLLSLVAGPSIARADDGTNTISETNGWASTNNNVDNSRVNRQDRDNRTRTPLEQGNSREDIQLTQQLRKYVVNGTNNFSMLARNIKIITRDGRVTLRGPVKIND